MAWLKGSLSSLEKKQKTEGWECHSLGMRWNYSQCWAWSSISTSAATRNKGKTCGKGGWRDCQWRKIFEVYHWPQPLVRMLQCGKVGVERGSITRQSQGKFRPSSYPCSAGGQSCHKVWWQICTGEKPTATGPFLFAPEGECNGKNKGLLQPEEFGFDARM